MHDLAKLKKFLNKTDVIESFSREKFNTKKSFYKLTILTVFAALLQQILIGCRDAVFLEPVIKTEQSTTSRIKEM